MQLRHPQDLGAGILFLLFGAGAYLTSGELQVGDAATMGPGYIPRMLALGLMLIGALTAARAFAASGPAVERFGARPLILVTLSVLVFAITVRWLGVIIATLLIVGIGSLADRESRPREIVIAGIVLAALSVGLFVHALGVQMPIWPSSP
ncbi:tripartite tricarboxylate transporter TctB family protein [Stella humosa]|uniref:Tripartite tricarboxylate transporter TctB family protein n=1 Tax=Stella humosa TaxID=94 RepID=A0A3N1MDQ2_9PROT|nr:tripartite tricarboxylate transporter TctB family protein [Stella humosa]ROQ01861.1 tripartite tricarboxylate transporter TctB family protein [Stella humosa]BBK32250.1 tripartite tricarboxylate transporter TctB [Stella humosa]